MIIWNIRDVLDHDDPHLCLTEHECKELYEYFMKCGFVNPKYTMVHSLIRQLREMNELHKESSGQR